ncbi:MAG TPA: hypothetical protein VM753_11810 [Anaeromyxobacter sp.]|nr:hypothetical protein [Anaeromyxobacter sp.]
MRAPAALVVAALALSATARAQVEPPPAAPDSTPGPDPAAPPAPPARAASDAATHRVFDAVGFEFRLGGAGHDDVFGAALAGRIGALRLGVAGEAVGDLSEHEPPPPGGSRVDRGGLALSGTAGLTWVPSGAVALGPLRPRADLLAELGWQWIQVGETFAPGAGTDSQRTRAFAFAGARTGLAVRIDPVFIGLCAFVRTSLADVPCIATSRSCERVGGTTLGLALYSGAEGRLR